MSRAVPWPVMSKARVGMGAVSGTMLLVVGLLAGVSVGGCCQSRGSSTSDATPAAGTTTAAATTAGGMAGTKAPPVAATAVAGADAKGVPPIPEGRSAPPTLAEWSAVSDVNQAGPNAKPRDCEIKIVREWMKIHCDGNVRSTEKEEGLGKQGSDYFRAMTPGKMADYVVRLRKGNAIKMRILRSPQSATVFVNWAGNTDRPGTIVMNIFAG
jgi:hypothetical protein